MTRGTGMRCPWRQGREGVTDRLVIDIAALLGRKAMTFGTTRNHLVAKRMV